MTEFAADKLDESPSTGEDPTPVVFFDGVCGMCNRFVDFLLRHDRQGVFRFAPLQGETARNFLPRSDTDSLGSLVLMSHGKAYRRSSAVVRILLGLGGCWAIQGALLWLIPLPLRNLGYRLVAFCRYRLFGKKESCRLPSPEERERFLD